MNAIDASLLSIQSEMDNFAKVIARLAATLEGFERQLTMQQSYERRQAALEHYRLEYEGPTCKTDDTGKTRLTTNDSSLLVRP